MLTQLMKLARKAKGADSALASLIDACHQLMSERGQANVYALAQQVMAEYGRLSMAKRAAFFAELATGFSPDPALVLKGAQDYAAKPGAVQLAALTQAVEPPRQELLRRINRAQGGTSLLLSMRNDLLEFRKANPELDVVDADFLHLLSSWFNPGFLRLEQVDWHSSAALLEKIIQHEAVHEITDWNDLRHRLLPDRRCYAFFHPQLPDEPLIFVEVALVDGIPGAIEPLIDKDRQAGLAARAKTAVFYSISNCQPGLRGVSLGNFLIKKVAGLLQTEFPQLKTFCTLSPIPGLTRWLQQSAPTGLSSAQGQALLRVQDWMSQHGPIKVDAVNAMPEALRDDVLGLCAHFLVEGSHAPGADPVARFHLDNGARLENIHFAADLSRKGIKQSLGLMVNYLYELGVVENRHLQFVDRRVSHSSAVRHLIKRIA